MRFQFHFSQSAKARLGHATVAVVLMLSLLASYGCGADNPARGDELDRVTATPISTYEAVGTSPPVVESTNIEPVAHLEPTNRTLSYDDADLAYGEGRFADALEMFTRYTHSAPANPWGFFMLGLSARKTGDTERSILAFKRALELDPHHVKSHLNLARTLLGVRRYEDAGAHVQRALDLDPESNDGYRLLGRVCGELGDVDGAVDAYQRALVLNEWDAWSMNNLGLMLFRQARYEHALLPLARATELRGDVSLFQNNLGMVLEHLGGFVEASRAYETAVDLEPNNSRAAANLARIEGRENRQGIEPLDLHAAARDFADEIITWRAALADQPVPNPIGEPPLEDEDADSIAVIVDSVTAPPVPIAIDPTKAAADTARVRP